MTREEQFQLWFENATRGDLVDAVSSKKRARLESSFQDSREYERALEDYIADELEGSGEMDNFDDSWFDPDLEDEEVEPEAE